MRRLVTQFVVLAIAAVIVAAIGGVSTVLTATTPVAAAVADTSSLDAVRAQLADARRELDRTHQIMEFSGRYAIPADLSAEIYDMAVDEGIPPAVGFQLVKVESQFQNGAQSSASAFGLTQLRLATARGYDATVDASDLMNPTVNLRLGFRYLKDLMDRFHQNLPLALEAYNKGPTFVSAAQEQGVDVLGRYSKAVISGVRRRG